MIKTINHTKLVPRWEVEGSEKEKELVPFTIDEYRKADWKGKRNFKESLYRQRMQTAWNATNQSAAKLKQACAAHKVECVVFYAVEQYGRLKKRIDAGAMVSIGGALYNKHEDCEKCETIMRHMADVNGYRAMARKWQKRLDGKKEVTK